MDHLPNRRDRGDSAQTVTVREPVSGQTWTITIDANTIARKTAAVALVLDRSGSMSEDRGDGQSKHVSLQQAAKIFVDVMLEGDGVGLVRYNQDAQVLQPVLPLGTGGLSDLNRSATNDLIHGNGFDPAGATSIGDGIFEGRGILNAAGSFDVKALAVLTDGDENRARYIADVARRSTSAPTRSASVRRRTPAPRRCRPSRATMAASCWSPAASAPITASCCRSTSCRSWPASATPKSCSTPTASWSAAPCTASRFS